MAALRLRPMNTLQPNHRVLAFEETGFPLLGRLYVSEHGVRTFNTNTLIKSAETVAGWLDIEELWAHLDKDETVRAYERGLRDYLGY